MNGTSLLAALAAKSARATGVSRLCRFLPPNYEKLALLLEHRKLRPSDPARFNDPFDCRPWFSPQSIEESSHLEAFLSHVRSVLERVNPASLPSFDTYEVPQLLRDREYRAQVMKRLSYVVYQAISTHIRLVCLSRDPMSQLLWSHYADAHSGVCIEFDSTVAPFGDSIRVTYQHDFPKLVLDGTAEDTFVQTSLLTKARCWEYEDEYRLLTTDIDGMPYTRSHDGFIDIPAKVIVAIYLGLCASDKTIAEVTTLVRKHCQEVAVRRVRGDVGSYDLSYEDI